MGDGCGHSHSHHRTVPMGKSWELHSTLMTFALKTATVGRPTFRNKAG